MTVLSSPLLHSGAFLLSLTCLLPCGTSLASAQTSLPSFGAEGKSQFPEGTAVSGGAMTMGDIDQDGDLDVLIAGELAYLNDGHADFRTRRLIAVNNFATTTFLVDLDGDKKLDLVLSALNNGFAAKGQTRLYFRDKKGRFIDFTSTHMPKDQDNTNEMAMGDVDGDGDLDLVLANGSIDGKKGQQNRLYLNNGKGAFTDATKTHMPVDSDLSRAVVLGDLDGDGDLDLVFGNGFPWLNAKGKTNKVYLNNGKGRFSSSKSWLFGRSEVTKDLLLADIDADGDLDLIEAIGDMYHGARNRVHANVGAPYGFSELAGAMLPESAFSTSLAIADLNEDGKLDLYVGNFRSPDRILLGNGRGAFTSPQSPMITKDSGQTTSVQIRDLDANGHLDILCGGGEAIRLTLGLGKGEFLETTTGRFRSLSRRRVQTTLLVDVDRDGDLDRIEAVADATNSQNGIWLGDGHGDFVDRTASHFPKDSDFSVDVCAGDVDGDGDLDLAFGNGSQNSLYLNDGAGHFKDVTFANLPKDSARTREIVFGDVDGDKDLDLVVANA